MNFKKGDRVIVKSEIENLFGGAAHLTPDFGEIGEICSGLEIMGDGGTAVRVKFINNFFWWIHPKHLEMVSPLEIVGSN